MCSVGAEPDDERIDFLLSELKGKDITELIAAGRERLASVPSGGGVAVAAPAGGAAAPAEAEAKKEEKVEEKEESDDVSFVLGVNDLSYFLQFVTIGFGDLYLCDLTFVPFLCRIWVSVSLTKFRKLVFSLYEGFLYLVVFYEFLICSWISFCMSNAHQN